MMKMFLFIVICLIASFTFAANSSSKSEQTQLIQKYLNALQQGDIEVIKELITGKMLSDRKTLLEKNKSYSEFLKNLYNGSNFEIKNSRINNDVSEVDVEVHYPSGEILLTTFVLKKVGEGFWKIADEVAAKIGN